MSDGSGSPGSQALYEDAACGLMMTAHDGTIRRVNRTFCRWLGRDADALVGRVRVQDLLTMGGRIFHQTHWAPLLQIQGSVAEVELQVVHADGRIIPMVMNAVRRDHDGVVVHELAAFVAEDRHQYERELLAARRRAEDLLAKEQQAQRALALTQQRLRLALDSAQLVLWDIDPDTRRPRYEDKVAVLLGCEAAEPVDPAAYAVRIHPDDRAAERQAYVEALDPAIGRYGALYRLRGVDGIVRSVSAAGRAFFDDAGRLQHFVGVLHDVTELNRRRAEAEDRALFAEQMVGIVSHDLRNPLSAIQMSALLLGRTSPTPNQLRVIERINSSTARANRLIADLLDFTQARVGRGLEVRPRPLDLHAVVSDSLEELRLAFEGRTIAHRRAGSGEPCTADPDRLAQAVGNLVSNAMSYGAADQPVVVTSQVDAQGFSIKVHNHGEPIRPDLLPHLFEPMTRGAVTAGPLRSVGLGLFIVRQIVRAHHGEIEAESSAEAGTTFTMAFPRDPDGVA